MYSKIKKHIQKNTLLQAFSLNGIATVVRLITGFITSKVLALFLGPSGIAITGNAVNFIQALEGITALGFKNGVIATVAATTKIDRKAAISAAFFLGTAIAIAVGFLLFYYALPWSYFIFGTTKYAYLLEYTAFFMPIYTWYMLVIGILQADQKVQKIVRIHSAGYVLLVLVCLLLVFYKDIEGALLAIICTPVVLFISLWSYPKAIQSCYQALSLSVLQIKKVKTIATFFTMTLIPGILIPLIFIMLRNYLTTTIDSTAAGYWEAIRKISNYYMLFIYTLFGLYLLPELTKYKTPRDFRKIICSFYKLILPVFILGAVMVYFCRDLLIQLIFTKDFLPMRSLFFWQLIGDFFKVISFTLAYELQAKKRVGYYLISEFFYMLLLYFLTHYYIDYLGLKGVVFAHAISYIIYTFWMCFLYRKKLFITI